MRKLLLALCLLASPLAQAQLQPISLSFTHWGLAGQDAFTRANSALTTPWVITAGAPQIVSNTVQVGAINTSTHAYLSGTYSSNQAAQIVVSAQNTGTCGNGAVVRLSGTSPTESFYQFATAGPVGAGSTVQLIKVLSGSLSVLNSWTVTTSVGDKLWVEAINQTLNVYDNGVQLGSVTDPDISTGNPGISIYSTAATTDCALDNFVAWNINVAVASSPPPPVTGLPFPRIGVQAISGSQLMPAANDNALAQYEWILLGGNYSNWSSSAGRTRDALVVSLEGQPHSGKNAVVPQVFQYENIDEYNPSSPWFPEWNIFITSNNWTLYNSGTSGATTPSAFNPSFNLVDMAHVVGTAGGGTCTGLFPYACASLLEYNTYITGSDTTRGSGMASTHLNGVFTDNTAPRNITGGAGDWLRTGTAQSDTNATAIAATQPGKQDLISEWRSLTSSYLTDLNSEAGYDCSTSGNGGLGINCAGLATNGTADQIMQQFMYASTSTTCSAPLNFGGFSIAVGWYQIVSAYTKAGGTPLITGCLAPTDYTMLRYSLGFCMVAGNAVCVYGLGNNDTVDNDSGTLTGCTSQGCAPVFDEFWGGTLNLQGFCGQPLATSQGAVQTAAWQNGVWRRDFQGCFILVNPAGNGSQTVTFSTTYWHMHGSQAPGVNTGASATSTTIAAGDGQVFLYSAPP